MGQLIEEAPRRKKYTVVYSDGGIDHVKAYSKETASLLASVRNPAEIWVVVVLKGFVYRAEE